MILYLTRHGQTDNNAAGLVQGRGLDPDLNDTGRAQAQALSARLEGVALDAVYTSTQMRSQQTAQPTLASHPEARFVVRDGLDEMDWGVHEGRGYAPGSADTDTADAYADLNREWGSGRTDVQVEGGESPDEVWARVKPVLEEIGEAYPDGHVLVVSHRRLLRILLAGALHDGRLALMKDYPHDNAGLTMLDLPGGRLGGDARLGSLNDTSFLSAA